MKKRKMLKWIIAVVIILAIVADIVVGNYLVTFAIARKDKVNDVAPDPVTKSDAQKMIADNTIIINDKMEKWADKASEEDVSITSDDGLKLKAYYYPSDEDNHLYLILVHGYTGQGKYMRDYAPYYAEKGYSVLIPDLRAHGNSEGSYIGMGWPDRKDMLQWINYIIEKDSQAKIVLHGVSMGGATVMMTSGEDLPDNVIAIVEDCGYTSVWDVFSDELKYLFNLPEFPFLHTASVISRIRAGYSFKEASAILKVQNARVPIIFIHGSEDNFVHTDMVYELYDACPTEKDLYVAEGAGHGQAMYIDPDEYFNRVFTFLEKYE